jgi:UDP-3-O-[3-hydroxymyristoyl] glucosamine N-acyltransferase
LTRQPTADESAVIDQRATVGENVMIEGGSVGLGEEDR